MKNRLIGVVLAFVAATLLAPAPARAGEEGDFIVEGGGWGHGVGMSQYGAQAMALAGHDVASIISHYYSGATLGDVAGLSLPAWILAPEALAVNVASNRTHYRFWVPQGSMQFCHRVDGTCQNGTVTVGQRLQITTEDGATCTREVLDGSLNPVPGSKGVGSCSLDLTWNDDFEPGIPSTLIRAEGMSGGAWAHEITLARGPIHVRPRQPTAPTKASFDVTVRLGLEEYLFGIAEMPLSWHTEALKAQAVTARSYAVRRVRDTGGSDGSGRIADCGCHIRRTAADQVYAGWTIEGSGSAGLKWRDQVVRGTTGLVVTHAGAGGGVVTTYYSSSTGGSTENVEDVFGGPPQSHLRAVPDPWSIDPAVNNPYATWEKTVPRSSVAAWFGWDEVTAMDLVAGPPGSTVRFRGRSGGMAVEATRTGWQVRQRFGLRSPYISGIRFEGEFVDIAGSIHREDILYIWRADVTRGCNPPTNTMYCPKDPVTRQQMASFLVRALRLPRSDVDYFVDDAGSVHQADINALAQAGITRGCNPPHNDRFCPERPVTRAEMAAFLVRAYGYADRGEGDLFVDDDGSIFEADIDRLAVAGVTRGCNPPHNDRFCPHDPVTREQMASFLARAMRLAGG